MSTKDKGMIFPSILEICPNGFLLSKLLASLMRNYFQKRPSGAPLHTLSKLYDVPFGLVLLPPILRLNIAYFAVAEGWLLLDIG